MMTIKGNCCQSQHHRCRRRLVEEEEVENILRRHYPPSPPLHCNNDVAQSSGWISFGLILFGILWVVQNAPQMVECTPTPVTDFSSSRIQSVSSNSGDSFSKLGFLERAAYNLMERASSTLGGGGGGNDDGTSSKIRKISPRRNLWELISSSSNVIPLRSSTNNSSYSQWPGGGAGDDDDGGSGLEIPSTSRLRHNYPQLSIESRLQKLEHHFNSLRVYDDDCRQRLLCEIAESPAKFVPLTSAFLDETSFNGDEGLLASKLLETNEGTRLLTYIEATQRGASRQGCEIWTYRCPRGASAMIDFKALLVWREISKWLTIKFVANGKKTERI